MKLDTNSKMITELAAVSATSNAINVELMSVRSSLPARPEDPFSAIHDGVRESLDASMDRLFCGINLDDEGHQVSRKRKAEPSNGSHNKRTRNADLSVMQIDLDCTATDPLPSSLPSTSSNQLPLPQRTESENIVCPSATKPAEHQTFVDEPTNDAVQQSINVPTAQLPLDSVVHTAPLSQVNSVPLIANQAPVGAYVNNVNSASNFNPSHPYPTFYYPPMWHPFNMQPSNYLANNWLMQPPGQFYPPNIHALAPFSSGQRSKKPAAKNSKSRSNDQQSGTRFQARANNAQKTDDLLTYCVRNFTPTTSCTDVVKFITSKNVPESAVTCSTMTKLGKRTSYISFKLSVQKNFAATLTANGFWPAGIVISPYEKTRAIALPLTA